MTTEERDTERVARQIATDEGLPKGSIQWWHRVHRIKKELTNEQFATVN